MQLDAHEIVWCRAGLALVVLELADLLDSALADRPGGAARWISEQLVAELDAAAPGPLKPCI